VGAVVWKPVGWGRLTARSCRGPSHCRPEAGCHQTTAYRPASPGTTTMRVIDVMDEIAQETASPCRQIRDQLAAAATEVSSGDHRARTRGTAPGRTWTLRVAH